MPRLSVSTSLLQRRPTTSVIAQYNAAAFRDLQEDKLEEVAIARAYRNGYQTLLTRAMQALQARDKNLLAQRQARSAADGEIVPPPAAERYKQETVAELQERVKNATTEQIVDIVEFLSLFVFMWQYRPTQTQLADGTFVQTADAVSGTTARGRIRALMCVAVAQRLGFSYTKARTYGISAYSRNNILMVNKKNKYKKIKQKIFFVQLRRAWLEMVNDAAQRLQVCAITDPMMWSILDCFALSGKDSKFAAKLAIMQVTG